MEDSKNYTVVFGNFFSVGSHQQSTTSYRLITVNNGQTIEEVLSKEEIEMSQVWFIFNGHHESLEQW